MSEFAPGQLLQFEDGSQWLVRAVTPDDMVVLARVGASGLTLPAEVILSRLGSSR